jgi:hypothetical protein
VSHRAGHRGRAGRTDVVAWIFLRRRSAQLTATGLTFVGRNFSSADTLEPPRSLRGGFVLTRRGDRSRRRADSSDERVTPCRLVPTRMNPVVPRTFSPDRPTA